MINFAICPKCDLCKEFEPSKYTEDGRLTVLPSVACELGGLLLPDSPLPEDCPYVLEQQLLEENSFNECETLKEEIKGQNDHTVDI